jgi:hypothetical protein
MHERLNAINKAAVNLRLDGEMVSVKVKFIPVNMRRLVFA